MPYRLRARNTATTSTNKIHDDAVARAYGFQGGLVPGVVVYAYMTHVPAAAWGADWLARGTMEARFVAPVYDGAQTEIRPGPVTEDERGTLSMELTVLNEAGEVRAVGRAGLPLEPADPPDIDRYPAVTPPATPPPATPEAFHSAPVLGAAEVGFRGTKAALYLDEIGEGLDLYQGGSVAHPGWLLRRGNDLLMANVTMGPWIHTESRVQHYSPVVDGDAVGIRGRVAELDERKGHRFVTLDCLVIANRQRPVMHLRHTAIYRPRPPGDDQTP